MTPARDAGRGLHLPQSLSSFIGREQALAAVKALLATTRLLTLTGPGGSGKTRLALRVAHDLAKSGAYPDGVAWTDLGDLADPALVPQAVAAALDVPEQSGRPLLQTLADHLPSRTVLLILDNAEHLLAACTALADALLRAAPRLTLLVTSREPLRLNGETVWRVPPLSVPDPLPAEGRAPTGRAADLARYEAVQLFTARAAAVLPSFRLSDANAVAVAETCRRLDGLPLALELAAAWTRLLSVEDIAARVEQSVQFLSRGSPAAPPRHQTLRATIDWSYALLAPPEQTLLQRLAVFAGGFGLAAAETVCAGSGLPTEAILETLAGLVDKSLVVVMPPMGPDPSTRYRLLETIRHYAHEKLAASGESAQVHDRHLAWYLALAERAVPELKGRAAAQWLRRLEVDHDNLRAALRWTQTAGRVEAGWRLAAALHWFWERRGYLSEGRAWLKTVLAAPTETGGPTLMRARAHALLGAAALAFDQGDWAEAAVQAEESAALFRGVDDRAGLTLALLRLGFAVGPASDRGRQLQAEALALAETVEDPWTVGITHYVVGQGAYFRADYPAARQHLDQALRRLRAVGDVLFLPRVLSTLGGMDLGLGEYSQARTRLEEALTLVQATNDPRAIALVAATLGDAARCQGDYARAEEVYQESLALYRALGAPADVAASLHNLGYVALGQGRVDAAAALQRESLLAQHGQGNRPGVAEGLTGLAAVAAARSELERAARLFGAAEALREQVKPMVWPAERFEWDRHVAALRARLDPATLTSTWAAGRAMPEEQAVEYALADAATAPAAPPPPSRRQAEKAYYGGLTAREREIAALIARGRTNRAIADELVIAERTVDRHVANMMAKLDCHSRAQIAAWAVEKGLTT